MKKVNNRQLHFSKYILLLLVVFISIVSCEDVIEVDLDSEDPRLIVDALIRVDTSKQLTDANIRVSLSSSFFDDIEPAEIDEMSIQNEASGAFIPYEPVPGEPGLYRPFATTISPVSDNKIVTSALLDTNDVYLLFVRFQDELFFARTRFAPTSTIDSVVQGDGELFDEDDTEVVIEFTDTPDREDFYVFDFDFGEFITSPDEFFQGQQFSFSYFYDADLAPGDEVDISILGAEEPFFDYMNGLLEQSQQGANGPFQTPVATIRGNILKAEGIDNINIFNNLDRPDEFALGYFSISQEFKQSLIIE
jgi:hypothetical protein